ncbi:hypothetical protein HYH02_001513 [Chlamydomonas schloesseri]|uniref:BACK domain-containing protein n=1 Tax=Chlamydomonas schloesseri TaxID=2026947 RepID=A0A835WVH7_9CHLO|nr:hypothetical protein HYH02_001513 [Chlamydomonas schloesseri]|eukprot:KAG2454495.1 hypothetical protein HYH02_001513 [Chlamydomonas schloesseri]
MAASSSPTARYDASRLQSGSELFRAQAERWSQREETVAGPAAAVAPGASDTALGKRKREDCERGAADDAESDGSDSDAEAAVPTAAGTAVGSRATAAGTAQQQGAAHRAAAAGAVAAASPPPQPTARGPAPPPPPPREVLRVVLDSAANLPFALNAIRYLYSGNLQHVQPAAPPSAERGCGCGGSGGSGSLAVTLLHTRRLALYLQMPDCVAACEQALVERVARPHGSQAAGAAAAGKPSAAGGAAPLSALDRTALAVVCDVYAARALLVPPLEAEPPATAGDGAGDIEGADPGAAALTYRLHTACLEQLAAWAKNNDAAIVKENQQHHSKWQELREQQMQEMLPHWGAASADATPQARPELPAFGELLAWAAVSAPHALTNPEAKKAVLQLPAAALEALLLADNFATDDESSVLLLLAEWLYKAPAQNTTSEQLRALQRLLRLGPYVRRLSVLLPAVAWALAWTVQDRGAAAGAVQRWQRWQAAAHR